MATKISAILDDCMEEGIKLTPIGATLLGVPGSDDKLDDFSMEGQNAREELTRKTLARIKGANPENEFDRVAGAVAIERLSSELKLSESYESSALFNLISSPAKSIRQVFEMMKKDAPDSQANVAKRLNAVSDALRGWCSTLEFVAGKGRVNSTRQVNATIGQLETFSKGAFQSVAKKFDPSGENSSLMDAAKQAESACLETAHWLRDSYLAKADPKDGVGEERYKIWARHFTGADLNLRDTDLS